MSVEGDCGIKKGKRRGFLERNSAYAETLRTKPNHKVQSKAFWKLRDFKRHGDIKYHDLG